MNSVLMECNAGSRFAACAMADISDSTISEPEKSYNGLSLADFDIRTAPWVAVFDDVISVYAFQPAMHRTVTVMKFTFIDSGRTAPLSNWPKLVVESNNSLSDDVDALLLEGREDAALKAIARATRCAKEREEFENLSRELELFDIPRYSDVILVALVRSSFSIRSKLPAWPHLLKRIEHFFNNKKEGSASRLLRGLNAKS